MKAQLISGIFLIIPFFITAQDFDYEVSKPYKVIDAELKKYFHKDGQILAVKVDEKKHVHIQTWDANSLKEISREKYDDFPKEYEIESIDEIKDKFYLFYSYYNKSKKNDELFVRSINIENGKFYDKGKRLIQVKGRVTEALPNNFNWWTFPGIVWGNSPYKIKFNLQKSFDQSKVLIQYRKRPEIRDDNKNRDVIGFNVFDDHLELISKKEIKMPYTESKMNNLDYSIDSKGNTFILSLVFKDDSQKIKSKSGKVNYKIELIKIGLDSKELHKTRVNVGSYHLNNVLLSNQADDQMICAGFYTKGKGGLIQSSDGVAIFKVDENGELIDLKTYEIPLEVLNMYQSKKMQNYNARREKKGKAELLNMQMKKIVVDEEGNVVLLGEQQYVETESDNFSTKKTYHFNEVLAAKIDNNGELVWMRKLGKLQQGSKGQKGMSFEYFYNNNSNYILFLDNVKNLDLKPDKMPARHVDGKGGFFTAYKIAHDSGEVDRVSLFDTRDVKGIDVFQFQVDRIVQVSPTEFVVEVYKNKKEDILIKVKVKE